jgi:prolipoprotein diacylglyceryltransferase
MFPILDVGPAAVQLPGLILLLGFWLSLSLAGRRAKAVGFPEDVVFNAGFFGLLAGLIGARLGYVALHWSAYRNDVSGILALSVGALSTPVGLLVGGGVAALYLRLRRPSAPILLDALTPALALMLAFISLADLSSGEAYGAVSDVPWAVELWGARRHPTQAYELFGALATLGILLWTERRRPYEGFLFHLFLAMYGAARLFLEAFRAAPWVVMGGYRTLQIIGLVTLVISLWLISRRANQSAS